MHSRGRKKQRTRCICIAGEERISDTGRKNVFTPIVNVRCSCSDGSICCVKEVYMYSCMGKREGVIADNGKFYIAKKTKISGLRKVYQCEVKQMSILPGKVW